MASVWSLADFAVPTVKWKTRCSLFCPVSIPVIATCLLAPGERVPMRKLESFCLTDDEVIEKPNGDAAVRTTLLRGMVAFERTVAVKVIGAPETVSVRESTDTERGVEEIARS